VNVLVCVASPQASRACRAAFALAGRLGNDAHVTILSAGHERNNPVFDEIRCPGFMRAVHLFDPALASADALVLGVVLGQAARWAQAEVVLTGTATDQEGRGLVPAALAHHLGANILSGVEDVAYDRAAADEIVAVRCARGQRLRLAFKFPVVLAVSPSAAPGPPLPDTATAAAAVEAITLAQLGITPDQLAAEPDRLGTLGPATGKPEVLASVDDLVARWLETGQT
jgi:electron transfer flavoprotein beta subunit